MSVSRSGDFGKLELPFGDNSSYPATPNGIMLPELLSISGYITQ